MSMLSTRERLMDATYEALYHNGYQGASLSEILGKAKAHKGSMYHFFDNKKEMALCAIREKLTQHFETHYLAIIEKEPPYLPHLVALLKDTTVHNVQKGCPLANLIQEMSHLDPDFHTTLKGVYASVRELFRIIFNQMVKKGELRPCDTHQLSLFALSIIEGGLLSAKASGDVLDYLDTVDAFVLYLVSLAKTNEV